MVSHKESCSRWDWHLLRVWGLLTTSCAFCTTAAGIRATAAGGSAQSGSQLMVLLLLPRGVPTAITRCREIQTPIEGGASCATTTAAFCTNTGATSCSTAPASSSTTATPSALRGRCSVPLGIGAAARLPRPGGTMVAVVAVFTALVKRLLRRRRDDEVDSRPKSCPRWCWCLLRVRGCATTTATFCTNTAASSCSTTPAILQHNAAPSTLRGRCSVPRSGPALRIVVEARLHHAGGTMVPHAALRR